MGGIRLYVLLILAVLASGVAALVPLTLTGADILESSYREYAIRDMRANSNLFALAARGEMSDSGLQALLARARAGSETRFTVVSRDGAVVADSDEAADRMENHANRPEIEAALAGSIGVDVRKSPTLGTEWIYVAVPFADGSVIRAAASLDELNQRLSLWWRRALLGFTVSLAILAALAFLVARALARPIEAAAAGADRYGKGDFSYRLPVAGAAETRRLSASLNAMAEELDSRFKLINHQREEMRILFENMSEGVIAIGVDGKVLFANKAAHDVLGLPGDVRNSTVETSIRNAEFLDALRDTQPGLAQEREIRVPRHGNGEATVQLHTVRMYEGGEDVGVLVVLRDVTRLRHLENMRRDFVNNVSHELRTPVTTIQSSLETVLEDGFADAESARHFLDMALRNTRRMGSIIGNLLFLAGMESGAKDVAGGTASLPVRPVVDEALDLCREEAERRKVTFNVSCEEGLTAVMNPQLIVHALVNLLDNAIKYGPEGGVIDVSAGSYNDRTRISVSDRGPGIASRYHSRVFERFYRVDGSARAKKGSGLGLALVKHIALAQGGEIDVESEIGSGSVFKLYLPRER